MPDEVMKSGITGTVNEKQIVGSQWLIKKQVFI